MISFCRAGSIHLHRRLMDGWLWGLAPADFKIATQLILLAEPTPGHRMVGTASVEVARGEVVGVVADLASHAGASAAVYRRALDRLVAEQFCAVARDGRRVRIKILNYDQYQVPCVAPVEPPPREAARPQAERRAGSAIADVDAGRERAVVRMTSVGSEKSPGPATTRRLKAGAGMGDALRAAAAEAWADAEWADWVGLYDWLYEQVYRFRSHEILQGTRSSFTKLIPLVKKNLATLAAWFPERDPKYQLYIYLRWIFRRERDRNQWAVDSRVMSRKPITIHSALDPDQLARWRTETQLRSDVESGRLSPRVR